MTELADQLHHDNAPVQPTAFVQALFGKASHHPGLSAPYRPDLLPATSGFSQIAVPAILNSTSLFYCSLFYVLALTFPELLPTHITARIFVVPACVNCTVQGVTGTSSRPSSPCYR
jgi:hypothetical protein